jgi:hypothetical protein
LLQGQDGVENEQYRGWFGFAPGAWVRLERSVNKSTSGDAVTLSRSETLFKVAQAGPGKIVLRVSTKIRFGNAEKEQPEYQLLLEPKNLASDAKVLKQTRGEDELTMAGSNLKCRWTETESEMNGSRTITKVWKSDRIPGAVVRMESRNDTSSVNVVLHGWGDK